MVKRPIGRLVAEVKQMKKKMPKGRLFQKGQSGNPNGRAKLPDDLKAANRLTAIQFMDLCNKCLAMTKEELIALTKRDETTALELLVASIVQKGVVEGDQKRLEFILDRLIGKITQNFNLSGSISQPQIVLTLPDNGRTRKD